MLKRIGVGGMGDVYAAYDEQLDRKVAIKLVRVDARLGPAGEERLLHEARKLAQLNHPNVVQIHEVGRVDDRVFVAMEFVRGLTLNQWLERAAQPGKRLPVRDILRHFIAAGRGLQAAHEAGLVHRDFKPGNVLIGDDGRARVADFGLAFATDGTENETTTQQADKVAHDEPERTRILTRTSWRVGTPRYMSPEQILGQKTDHRSDQFNFCVALYDALYGLPPFAGRTRAEIWQSVARGEIAEPLRGASVPQVVRKAVLRGLSTGPEQRFEDMAGLLAELEKASKHHSRWRWALAGAAIAAVGVSLFWYLGASRTEAVDPCARAGSEMNLVWNQPRQVALEQAFRDNALADAWPTIDGQLSTYAQSWREASATACQARNTQPERLQEHTARCLTRARERFSELVSELESRPGRLEPGAVRSNLYDPAICHRGAVLADQTEPPPADSADAIAHIEEKLARANALRILGRYSEAVALARRQVKRTQKLGYQPLSLEAQRVVGSALLYRQQPGDRAEGVAILERALVLSQEASQDRLTLDILNHLIANAILHDRDSSHGRRWVGMARTIMEQIEAGPPEHAALARNRGLLTFKDGDYAMAVEHHRSALAEADRAPDFPDALRALYHRDLGSAVRRYCITNAPPYPEAAYYGKSKSECLDRAEAEYQASLDYYRAASAGDDPQVAEARFGLAILAKDRGQRSVAHELLEGVLSTHASALGPDHPLAGKVYWNLAVIEWEMQRLDQAWEHAREARRIFEQSRDNHLADAMNTQGAIAFFRESPAAALAYYEEARTAVLAQEFPDQRVLGTALANIAEAHLELAKTARGNESAGARNHVQQARDAFDAAMAIQPRTDDLDAFLETLQPMFDELNR